MTSGLSHWSLTFTVMTSGLSRLVAHLRLASHCGQSVGWLHMHAFCSYMNTRAYDSLEKKGREKTVTTQGLQPITSTTQVSNP